VSDYLEEGKVLNK